MLAGREDCAVGAAAHDAAELRHVLPGAEDLALDEDPGADGDGADVGAVEGARDAEGLPVAGARDEDEGDGGGVVEEGGCAAAVEVSGAVRVFFLDGEVEGGGWEFGAGEGGGRGGGG